MWLLSLPVSQYPDVVPPTVSVTTRYPGASATAVIDTVALPIEQQVNGVEGMLYMQSFAASDGSYNLTVTFAIGTDLDQAQVRTSHLQRAYKLLRRHPPLLPWMPRAMERMDLRGFNVIPPKKYQNRQTHGSMVRPAHHRLCSGEAPQTPASPDLSGLVS